MEKIIKKIVIVILVDVSKILLIGKKIVPIIHNTKFPEIPLVKLSEFTKDSSFLGKINQKNNTIKQKLIT